VASVILADHEVVVEVVGDYRTEAPPWPDSSSDLDELLAALRSK